MMQISPLPLSLNNPVPIFRRRWYRAVEQAQPRDLSTHDQPAQQRRRELAARQAEIDALEDPERWDGLA